jgi:hypothetical protein
VERWNSGKMEKWKDGTMEKWNSVINAYKE